MFEVVVTEVLTTPNRVEADTRIERYRQMTDDIDLRKIIAAVNTVRRIRTPKNKDKPA